MTSIVDTNVILVANEQHSGVTDECVVACARLLEAIRRGGRVAIDDGFRIVKEYLNKTTPHGGKRAGDVFVKWVLQNNAKAERCDHVKIVEHAERGFENFPDDERLTSFDLSDRKFVAVAIAHAAHPPIAQATDSKWLDWVPALRDHGVAVELVCPRDIQGFDDKKKGRSERLS